MTQPENNLGKENVENDEGTQEEGQLDWAAILKQLAKDAPALNEKCHEFVGAEADGEGGAAGANAGGARLLSEEAMTECASLIEAWKGEMNTKYGKEDLARMAEAGASMIGLATSALAAVALITMW